MESPLFTTKTLDLEIAQKIYQAMQRSASFFSTPIEPMAGCVCFWTDGSPLPIPSTVVGEPKGARRLESLALQMCKALDHDDTSVSSFELVTGDTIPPIQGGGIRLSDGSCMSYASHRDPLLNEAFVLAHAVYFKLLDEDLASDIVEIVGNGFYINTLTKVITASALNN